MPKFRKKPVVIEAEQFAIGEFPPHGRGADEYLPTQIKGPDGRRLMFMEWPVMWDDRGLHIVIETLEGNHRADLGDWIIKGVKGEFYACKPDIFEMTYEPVEE